MVQQLNPEFIPKIKASIEELEGNTVPSIRKGMDNIEEIPHPRTKAYVMISSGKSFAEGTAALLQAATDLITVLGRVHDQYSKLDEALN